MQKISSNDAAALLKQAGSTIRALTADNQRLQGEIDGQKRDARIIKLAQDMEEKGLKPEYSLAEKVAHLRKVKTLDVTEQAVKLAAPQGNLLGEVGEEAGSGGKSPFETFIDTGEDVR
jgi:hypothetical protein